MTTKYIAAFIRRNIDTKDDYLSYCQHENQLAVLFDNYDAAFETAVSICADSSHACYCPKAIPVIQYL
jgi:hypothetical protein